MNNTEYGKLFGEVIVPPHGWELVPEGDEIPQIHREFIINPPFRDHVADSLSFEDPERDKRWSAQWARDRRCRGTGTPPFATLYGHVLAYARQKKVIARIWITSDHNSIIEIRDPRQFIGNIKRLNDEGKLFYRIDEEVAGMFYGKSDHGIKEMITKYMEIIPTLPKETYYYPKSSKAV